MAEQTFQKSSVDEDYQELAEAVLCDNAAHNKRLRSLRPNGFYILQANARFASLMTGKPLSFFNRTTFGFYCPECRLMVEPIGHATRTITHCHGVTVTVPERPDASLRGLIAAVKFATLPRFKWSPVELFRI